MLNPILNIITAVSRELNLYYIEYELRKIKNLDIRWYLVFDGISMTSLKIPKDIKYYHAEISNPKKRDSSGAVQKNIALSKITEGWIYALDDDNSIHPNFEKEFLNAIKKYPNKKESANYLKNWTLKNLSKKDASQFERVITQELESLHEGNIARFRIQPEEFQAWHKKWI